MAALSNTNLHEPGHRNQHDSQNCQIYAVNGNHSEFVYIFKLYIYIYIYIR